MLYGKTFQGYGLETKLSFDNISNFQVALGNWMGGHSP